MPVIPKTGLVYPRHRPAHNAYMFVNFSGTSRLLSAAPESPTIHQAERSKANFR